MAGRRPNALDGAAGRAARARAPGRSAAPARPAATLAPVRAPRGQATVELVALLPLAVLIALAIGQLLAAGAARELAGNAAVAGAVAMLQGADPAAAARDALPGWSRERAAVHVDGRHVEVRVRPRALIPGLADRLAATGAADAGPAMPPA
jgi:hypothetical protein